MKRAGVSFFEELLFRNATESFGVKQNSVCANG